VRNKYSPLELIFGAIVVMSFGIILYPALANMAVAGDDAMLHLKWIEEFNALKDSGIYYPRFCGDFQNHLGSPIFYFYPPLSFFAAWCTHSVCPSITPNGLFNIVQLLIILLSFGSFYHYSGSFSKRNAERVIGAVLYASLPYRFLDAFIRSAFSEHVAFIFIPLVLLGIERTRERSMSRAKEIPVTVVMLTAFSWAALILSSIPMTAIMLLTAAIYLFLRVPVRPVRYFVEYALSTILGAMLAAVYLIPLATFLPLVEHGKVFHYVGEFRYPIYFLFQSRVDNLIFPSVMLLAAILLFILLRKNSNRFVLVLLAFGAITQVPYIADPLWNSHLFDTIVYPVRFCALLCIAIPLGFLVAEHNRKRQVLVVLSAMLLFTNYREIKWIVNHAATAPINLATVTFDTPLEYALVIPPEASRNGIMDTSLSQSEYITEFHRDGNRSTYHVALLTLRRAIFKRTFWPTWSAKSSMGQELSLSCNSDGRISALLPAGNYDVDVQIVKSSAEEIGMVVSAVTLGLIVIFVVGYGIVRYKNA
jgi:uncharacterized membrane protein